MIYVFISVDASSPRGTRPHLGATQSHLGATRPRVGIVKLGLDAPTWQYNDERGTHFVFACQGIEPCQANADAGTRRPQVRLRPPPGEIVSPQVRLRPPPSEDALSPSLFSL